MNEKIKELAKLSNIDVGNTSHTRVVCNQYNLDKFAELLLQEFAYECIDVTNQGERIQWIAKKWGISI